MENEGTDEVVEVRTCSPAETPKEGSSEADEEVGIDSGECRDLRVIEEFQCDTVGKRSFEIRGVRFTVDEKYELLKLVGVGAYGVVVACEDRSNGERVALKKISGAFDDLTDAKRILREIRLMQTLDHENVSWRNLLLFSKSSTVFRITNICIY